MNKNNKGFTLIELLVVIAIIGLLSSIILVSVEGIRNKAKNNKKNQLVSQYIRAADMHYDKYDEYPDPGNTIGFYCLGPYSASNRCFNGQGYNTSVSNSFAEFIAGPPSDETIVVQSDVYGYKGLVYKCLSSVDNLCKSYQIVWALIGDKDNCVGNSTTALYSGNKICYFTK